MNTTKKQEADRPVEVVQPAPTNPLLTDTISEKKNELNMIREILVGPTEELAEERIVELVRMLDEQEAALNNRMSKLEADMKKVLSLAENNQMQTLSEIGNAMVAIGQRVINLQEKMRPVEAQPKADAK
ncbi:MAG: hypothetical protein ACR2PM_16180 [Hyphomicrobiales bacterium]